MENHMNPLLDRNTQPITDLQAIIDTMFVDTEPAKPLIYVSRIVEHLNKKGKTIKLPEYDAYPFQTWLKNYLTDNKANYYRKSGNCHVFLSGTTPLIYLNPDRDGKMGWTW
jgi:hypothetical protein